MRGILVIRVPNLTEDTDVLHIHCDLTSTSLVDGEESDIIYSFGTSTLRAPYGFVLERRRVFFNPVNKTSISSIRIYITDGLRRPVYLNRELKQEDFSRRRRGEIREGPGLTSSFSSQI